VKCLVILPRSLQTDPGDCPLDPFLRGDRKDGCDD
jgi:hypothetical protein